MTYLDEILQRKKPEIVALGAASRHRLDERLRAAPKPRSLHDALRGSRGIAVIAEIKRASPSVGTIRTDLDVVERSRTYAAAGASAISVLTDGPGFGGSFDDLVALREHMTVPLLCKDFITDEIQIEEARASGADAALLIVAALPERRLRELLAFTESLGMEALVETHDEAELERAVGVGATVIGVNNRDLQTFEVHLGTSARLLPLLPARIVGVAESGVRDLASARTLADAGARALLIGEALVRLDDPTRLITAIRGLRP